MINLAKRQRKLEVSMWMKNGGPNNMDMGQCVNVMVENNYDKAVEMGTLVQKSWLESMLWVGPCNDFNSHDQKML